MTSRSDAFIKSLDRRVEEIASACTACGALRRGLSALGRGWVDGRDS